MDELERSGGLLYNKTLSQKSNIKSRVSMEQSVKNPNALCLCSISVGISIVGKIVQCDSSTGVGIGRVFVENSAEKIEFTGF